MVIIKSNALALIFCHFGFSQALRAPCQNRKASVISLKYRWKNPNPMF